MSDSLFMDCSTPGSLLITNLQSLLKLLPSSWWCHRTISPSVILFPSRLPSCSASGSFPVSQFFSSDWGFNFSIIPSNGYSGLISFSMDYVELFAVQGALKSLLQHHSSKASALQCSAFLMVQVSHPCTIIGKTIALTRQTFVGKVMSLFFWYAL